MWLRGLQSTQGKHVLLSLQAMAQLLVLAATFLAAARAGPNSGLFNLKLKAGEDPEHAWQSMFDLCENNGEMNIWQQSPDEWTFSMARGGESEHKFKRFIIRS